jgi:hypothetical protein
LLLLLLLRRSCSCQVAAAAACPTHLLLLLIVQGNPCVKLRSALPAVFTEELLIDADTACLNLLLLLLLFNFK